MKNRKVRYAVVGLGHIAQVAVLPGFRNARNSELVALVSSDATKLKALAEKYDVTRTYSYEDYDACLASGEVDAVYIALPNHMHREYTVRAAKAGIHVLCEKPMAVTVRDCETMMRTARLAKIKLMIAYRLHFDPANLEAIRIVSSGKIGEPRYFTSEFGFQLKEDNIRALPEEGGSSLHDIGIYCINAARYLFKADPIEVFAFGMSTTRRMPKLIDTVTATLKFPGDRLAAFTCSFGSASISNFRVVGTRGDLFVENAYEYVGELKHRLTINEKSREWKTKAGDQFAAELAYFSDCVLANRHPEPSGLEGLADIKIIEALERSIRTGRSVPLAIRAPRRRPTARQKIKRPPHREPHLIKATSASR